MNRAVLSPDELLLTPGRFDIFDKNSAVDSELLTAGLYLPVPLWKGEPVWGFNIARSAIRSGIGDLVCTTLQGSAETALLTALKLENRTGKYTWEERLAIADLAETLNVSVAGAGNAVSIAVDGDGGFLTRIAEFRGLPPWLRVLVAEKRLDLKSATRIDTIPREVCEQVSAYSGFSFSEFRLFLTDLSEVLLRDSVSADQAISLTATLLEAVKPLKALAEVRYPALSDTHRRFAHIEREYVDNTGIKVDPPAYFEGDSYTVTFSFRNGAELKRKSEVLGRLVEACDRLEELL